MSSNPKGKLLLPYFGELAQALESENSAVLGELRTLLTNIEHIKAIVRSQQSYARGGASVIESVSLQELCENALQIGAAELCASRRARRARLR